MTKRQFMIELAGLLSKIPEEERNDAINYYEDYFADAKITDEMLVPASVGTPKQVADKIIGETVYVESPKQKDTEPKKVPVYYQEYKDEHATGNTDTYYDSNDNGTYQDGSDKDNTKLILAIVIAVITSPIWISILASVVGILFGIFAALGGMIVGFGVAGIALIVVGVLSAELASGLLLAGVGVLLLALAFLLVILFVMYCGNFLPWLIRKFIKLVKNLSGKKE